MENNKIGTFIEEPRIGSGGKIFTLVLAKKTIPCTEQEKRIYGVDIKLDVESQWLMPMFQIWERTLVEGGVFYELMTREYFMEQPYFQNLDTAKKYLIEEAKKQKLL